MLKLPEIVHTSPNLKCLVLSIFPFDDEDKLYWLSYIFEAFPLLQKLQLNVRRFLFLFLFCFMKKT